MDNRNASSLSTTRKTSYSNVNDLLVPKTNLIEIPDCIVKMEPLDFDEIEEIAKYGSTNKVQAHEVSFHYDDDDDFDDHNDLNSVEQPLPSCSSEMQSESESAYSPPPTKQAKLTKKECPKRKAAIKAEASFSNIKKQCRSRDENEDSVNEADSDWDGSDNVSATDEEDCASENDLENEERLV